ncbi:MAG: response regulator [Candidatus Firestonebacteria bacterium]|nr:response regulator [Candidatus Firestonebacteria bacterium]
MSETEKMLFVDDDANLLAALQRTQRKQFDVDIAASGEAGLAMFDKHGPYAVVVSDMRMPVMNGAQFLAKVRELAPDCIRIMLTGQADMKDAIEAVNRGNIFRFLTKPCSNETLAQTLDAGLQQYRLVHAERELLEKTLNGTVKVLSDVLSLVNPVAFSRGTRLKRYVHHMLLALNLEQSWFFEMAALLSQIGCVTVPPDVLQKHFTNQALSPDETQMLDSFPAVGRDLLANIPRLEIVAQMIGNQQTSWDSSLGSVDLAKQEPAVLGAQILGLTLQYDRLLTQGLTAPQALDELQHTPAQFDARLVACLKEGLEKQEVALLTRTVEVWSMQVGMILDEAVKTNKGVLLVPKGQTVSETLLRYLLNFARRGDIPEELKVLVPEVKPEEK